MSKKYGISLEEQTPSLNFDSSGTHPVAVTGARFMLLFVWKLDTVSLLWAFFLRLSVRQKNAISLE